MDEKTVEKIELPDEFWQAYAQRVEELIESRQRTGSLLSTFDLVAGASIIYFTTGNNNKLPAKWVFAAVRDGLLPDGLMEQAARLDGRLSELRESLSNLDDVAAYCQDTRQLAEALYKKIKATVVKEGKIILAEADKKNFPFPEPKEQE